MSEQKRRSDDPKSTVGEILSHSKKYGLMYVLVSLAPFYVPYIEKWFDKRQARIIRTYMEQENNKQTENIVNELRRNLKVAIDAHGKTKITDEQALYLMKVAVGFQSISKVEWIVSFLTMNPNLRDESIKQAIRSELIRQSSVYINSLNKYVHSDLGMLGDFVADNFPMDEFLETVYGLALDKKIDIDDRGQNILYIMLGYQDNLWYKAKGRLR